MTYATNLRVVLILPPTQSFFMPYVAPFLLATWLKENYGAEILVIDAGIDWLLTEAARFGQDSKESRAFAALRDPQAYSNIFTLHEAVEDARQALTRICSPWFPERVELSGRYFPPSDYADWSILENALDLAKPGLFDRYFREVLLPMLQRFSPDIVGLSVPFDWMILPAMRLSRLLRNSLPGKCTIAGGHAIKRLWQAEEMDFFRLLDLDWVAVRDGESAFTTLIQQKLHEANSIATNSLIKLPVSEKAYTVPSAPPVTLVDGVLPDFSGIQLSRYLRPETVIAIPGSFGCFYGRCRFCSRQRSDQSTLFYERDARDVAEAMRQVSVETGCRQFILGGDIFTHRFLLSLASILANERLTWGCLSSFKWSLAGKLSLEQCRALYRGGCRVILNGLESGSARMRELMGCPVRQEDYDQTLMNLAYAGIIPVVTLLIGYPGESRDDLANTVDYVLAHSTQVAFYMSRFEIVSGTPLSLELRKRPNSQCCRRSVLDSGLEYVGPDVVPEAEANALLNARLGGMFGTFAELLRSMPMLLQLVEK